jgi:hypothetical protein
MAEYAKQKVSERGSVQLLLHENGIQPDEATKGMFTHQVQHDPTDINTARTLAEDTEKTCLGLFYQNKNALRYDLYGAHNLGFTVEEKMAAIARKLDAFVV